LERRGHPKKEMREMGERRYEELRQRYIILFERLQTQQRTSMSMMTDLLACIEELENSRK